MPQNNDLAGLLLDESSRKKATPVWLIPSSEELEEIDALSEFQNNWLKSLSWKPTAGALCNVPTEKGKRAGVVFVYDADNRDPLQLAVLSRKLPKGVYELIGDLNNPEIDALAWLLGRYHYTEYKTGSDTPVVTLKLPKNVDRQAVLNLAESVFLGRNLINTPSNDMGPEELENAIVKTAKKHKASLNIVRGDDLLEQNYPLIHAVGRASTRAPRLVEFTWGAKKNPSITIVGKGICFDTGGLNIKPGQGMILMKKDMGGAATALSLADMVMSAKLAVRLHVIIPIAENSISGNAFRPSDVLPSRNGMSVEIRNTDAEGRLVLADALSLGDEQAPDHMISFATLTGAARVAIGEEIVPFYSTSDSFAEELQNASLKVGDPTWRFPFWDNYNKQLKSAIADVSHASDSYFAGSITAALFLQRFVSAAKDYTHFDIYGWVPSLRPGKPKGGEPQAARAVFRVLQEKYGA